MEMKSRREGRDRRARSRVYRSPDNAIVAGVVGGASEYLGTDAAFLRIVCVLLALMTGILPGVVVYLIAALLIPKRQDRRSAD